MFGLIWREDGVGSNEWVVASCAGDQRLVPDAPKKQARRGTACDGRVGEVLIIIL